MGLVSPYEDVFNGPNAAPGYPATADDAYNSCQSVDVNNPANQFPIFMGAPWGHGQHHYQHMSPPNARSCGWLPSLRSTMAATSRHPGGVNVAFADGGVRFVPNSIDLAVWRGLGSRDRRRSDARVLTGRRRGGRRPAGPTADTDQHGHTMNIRDHWCGPWPPSLVGWPSWPPAVASRAARTPRSTPGRPATPSSAALESWKKGEPSTALEKASPPIYVIDPDWQAGAKLIDYEILGPGEEKDAQLFATVRLVLRGPDGKDARREVTFMVATAPNVTVARKIF